MPPRESSITWRSRLRAFTCYRHDTMKYQRHSSISSRVLYPIDLSTPQEPSRLLRLYLPRVCYDIAFDLGRHFAAVYLWAAHSRASHAEFPYRFAHTLLHGLAEIECDYQRSMPLAAARIWYISLARRYWQGSLEVMPVSMHHYRIDIRFMARGMGTRSFLKRDDDTAVDYTVKFTCPARRLHIRRAGSLANKCLSDGHHLIDEARLRRRCRFSF